MTAKYPVWVYALLLVVGACAPQDLRPAGSASGAPSSVAAPPSAAPGLTAPVPGSISVARRWWLLPDGFDQTPLTVSATFEGDPARGEPFVLLDGRETRLRRTGAIWTAAVPLAGVAPGEHTIGVFERLPGTLYRVATTTVVISHPQYVVWTLDFEGDASGDAELANAAAIADALKVPMVVFWNPRAWTTAAVSPERQDAMLAWTKGRLAKGDEVGLHLHLWTDYVRAAGLTPRLLPSWAGRSDGYDVPLTAYPEADQLALMSYGTRLMVEHGLPRPTSFRAGGDIGDATTLRAAAAAGFTVDCTAVPRSAPPIGRIPFPWTLGADAQPYFPSRTDANAAGDLPLLESPTIGPNTYAATVGSIQPYIRAAQALFAPPGQVATERRTIDLVSHPGTIVPTERAAIEAYLHSFDGQRYDADRGPVRFVTLQDLANGYAR
jgi:hypothetical protein